MLANVQRKEVGIVGAKLLYPDNMVQHAGVIIGMGGIAGHPLSRHPADDCGYFARGIIQQNLNAVTAACMLTKKEVYEKVNGFEEKLAGANVLDVPAVTDKNVTTGRGMGAATDFALELIRVLQGEDKAKEMAEKIVFHC